MGDMKYKAKVRESEDRRADGYFRRDYCVSIRDYERTHKNCIVYLTGERAEGVNWKDEKNFFHLFIF